MNAVRPFSYSFLLLLLCSLLTFSAKAADLDTIEIHVLPDSVVYGDNYLLGDIAELDGFDLDTIGKMAKMRIGRSPVPGRSQLISRGQISAKISRKFKNKKIKIIIPKRAMVSRASLRIPKEQIQEIITQEVQKQYSRFDNVNIAIKTRLKDLYIPKGNASYNLKRIGKSQRIGGYATWKLDLKLDDRIVKHLLVRVKVDVVDEVVVAKDKIKRGESIKESDLTTIKKNISRETWNYEPEPDLVVGQNARRDIQKNEPLRPGLVEKPMVLEKGSHVKLIYKTKNLYLTNMVMALRSGREGDVIPVRTLNSKKTIYAVVVDSKHVEVMI